MNPRATLALFLAAGCPAAAPAQEYFLVHQSWNEVNAGTITPASGPLAGNSIVDPGEGARIRTGITAMINGTNAVGQTITYTNPAPGGVGTVRGLGSVVYDLLGDNNSATAYGTWMPIGPGFLGAGPPLNNESIGGTVQLGGASIHGMGGTQFIAPGGTANGLNNNIQLGRGVWTPASYSPRTVNWLGRASILVPVGQHNSVLLAYGLGTGIDPTTGQPFVYDRLVGKYFGTDFGTGLNIPIAPAPSSLALVCLSALLTRRSRRLP